MSGNNTTQKESVDGRKESQFRAPLKFLKYACMFLLVVIVLFYAFYWGSKALAYCGLIVPKWSGIGVAEMVVKVSKYGNLIIGVLAAASLFTTYISLEQKKRADERIAFYNRLHWALDKMKDSEGTSRQQAYELADTLWNSKVDDFGDEEIMDGYNLYMNRLMDECETTGTCEITQRGKREPAEERKLRKIALTVTLSGVIGVLLGRFSR